MSYQRTYPSNSHWMINILIVIVGMIVLYYLAKGFFWIAGMAMPFLLIATLIINYKVVLNYGKMLMRLLQNNVLFGIVAILLTVLAFPVVVLFLFGQALLYRKMNKWQEEVKKQKEGGDFSDFEEVSSETLELPQLNEKKKEKVIIIEEEKPSSKKSNPYDGLFD